MPQSFASDDLNYAESVNMTGYADDASLTFDVRIARFPAKGTATLWFYAFVDGQQYAMVDDTLSLETNAVTDVDAPDAEFSVTGEAEASLSGYSRHSRGMTGRLKASGRLKRTAHPDEGPGDVPVYIEAELRGSHQPIAVRRGRIEVMGRVQGHIMIDKERYAFEMPGKWHEQTGSRPQFAPAFTYLFVQSDGVGIMTTRHERGAWGYVLRNDDVEAVESMHIGPYGQDVRAFEVVTSRGAIVRGKARVVREVSVPIEGQRRPGAKVLVESDLGPMVGVLNDWKPVGSR